MNQHNSYVLLTAFSFLPVRFKLTGIIRRIECTMSFLPYVCWQSEIDKRCLCCFTWLEPFEIPNKLGSWVDLSQNNGRVLQNVQFLHNPKCINVKCHPVTFETCSLDWQLHVSFCRRNSGSYIFWSSDW